MATHLSRLLLLVVFFMLPSVSSAAALTEQQSTSLIYVIRSAPEAPASAFVSLITAFSGIRDFQAESLIAVVQAAPGVPVTSFVNMLLAFTVDPVIVVPTPTHTQETPTPSPAPVSVPPVSEPTQVPTEPIIVKLPIKIDKIGARRVIPMSDISGVFVIPMWRVVVNADSPSFIEVSLDGVSLGHPTGSAGEYVFALDTTPYPNGQHKLTVTISDEHGQVASEYFGIDIQN